MAFETVRAGHHTEGTVLSLGTESLRQGIFSRVTLRYRYICI